MLINCTPHEIFIIDPACVEYDIRTKSYVLKENQHLAGVKIMPSSLPLPRCVAKEMFVGTVDGVDVYRTSYGTVENLPDRQEGTFYIVSSLCAQAAPEREDLLIPVHLVRNTGGQILGCTALGRV